MKIAILSDIHANLSALCAVLKVVDNEKYDAVFNLGDCIGIGPFPSECVQLFMQGTDILHVQGNHEQYAIKGIDSGLEKMGQNEILHHQWTREQLTDEQISFITQWPFVRHFEYNGVRFLFLHYAQNHSRDAWMSIKYSPEDIQKNFQSYSADIICYGHVHHALFFQNRQTFLTPGALGCADHAVARFAEIHIEDNQLRNSLRQVNYNDRDLLRAFEERKVPDRHNLYKYFMGGRCA